MKYENGELLEITNKDIEEMVAGVQRNFILREGLCGVDLTKCDMSMLDFEHFKLLCFDENTVFSEEQQKKFKPNVLIKKARAPMEELQELHRNGIDGDGVTVAIIDTNIDVEEYKEEYGGNINYIESEFSGKIEQHGKTVLNSFLQTAPNAEIVYFPFDKTQREMKSEHFIQYLKQIVEKGIRIISLSNALENIISDKLKLKEIRAFFCDNGITLIDSPAFYKDFTYCFRDISIDGNNNYKECLCEPEDLMFENQWKSIKMVYRQLLQKYHVDNLEELKSRLENSGEIEVLQKLEKFEQVLEYDQFFDGENSALHFLKQKSKRRESDVRKDCIRIPCGGRALAGKYWGTSSASYSIPVVSGLFAMCRQINPQIEYEDFVKICKDTSKERGECDLIQPQDMIEKVKEMIQDDKRIEFTEEIKTNYAVKEDIKDDGPSLEDD